MVKVQVEMAACFRACADSTYSVLYLAQTVFHCYMEKCRTLFTWLAHQVHQIQIVVFDRFKNRRKRVKKGKMIWFVKFKMLLCPLLQFSLPLDPRQQKLRSRFLSLLKVVKVSITEWPVHTSLGRFVINVSCYFSTHCHTLIHDDLNVPTHVPMFLLKFLHIDLTIVVPYSYFSHVQMDARMMYRYSTWNNLSGIPLQGHAIFTQWTN